MAPDEQWTFPDMWGTGKLSSVACGLLPSFSDKSNSKWDKGPVTYVTWSETLLEPRRNLGSGNGTEWGLWIISGHEPPFAATPRGLYLTRRTD